MLPQVEALYEQQHDLDEAGRLYFERPIDNLLQQKIQYIHQWLKKTQNIIQLSIARSKNNLTNNPSIHRFFQRLPPKTTLRNRRQTTTATIRNNNLTIAQDVSIRNLDRTRPLPPPQPDPGNAKNDLVDFLRQPP